MNDDLRDEYEFDYRQAKPNRFAGILKKGGSSSQRQSDAELSDEQQHLLEGLYAKVSLPLDDLPYTDEMAHIHQDFVERSGLPLSIRDVYKALKNLGRLGRLSGAERSAPRRG